MNRRNFLNLTGTLTGGLWILPDFLYAFGQSRKLYSSDNCLVFIQLNGGNDGLNTFIPYGNSLYYQSRPNIAIPEKDIIGKYKGMGFHPALKDFEDIRQNGHLSVIQNVGYPHPNRSHFRSQEIWQTASASQEYLTHGWLGRYLDIHSTEHQPTAAINLDSIDNLALKGEEPNSITIKDPTKFKTATETEINYQVSGNPQLDFVRKIAQSITEGSEEIQNALRQSDDAFEYPKSGLSKNLQWIARLIKGNLHSKVYYTSQNGYDTHDNQLNTHQNKLSELNDAVYHFYKDLKQAQILDRVTLVIFSEFGRRVKDNGNGTDHGTAAPLFIIGGGNKGTAIGPNPNLSDLDEGDLKFEIDFRSVYATLLKNQLDFDPTRIGIQEEIITSLF